MANYQTSFRQEVQRIARKEIRSELKSTKQAVSRYRSEIAALKRKHKELERLIKALQSRKKNHKLILLMLSNQSVADIQLAR